MHPATWQGHHRKLRSRGGQDTVPNAVALCANDHVLASWAVHRNPAVATRDGWIVPAHIDPADVPITLHDGRTVWLTDDGAYSTDRPDHEETRAA